MTTPEPTFPNRLRYQQIVIALMIVALAFTLRVIVIWQRAEADEQFLPYAGSDPYTYVEQGRGVLDGSFPPADKVFFHHPAPPYIFAIFLGLFNDSVPMLLIGIALLDSLTVGWLIASGWLLTERSIGGYVTGLVYALYPLAIYYGTTGILAPLAMAFLAPIIFLTLWQREKLVWWRTPLIGILAGIMSLIRLNFLPFMGLSALWILARPAKWSTKIAHVVVLIIITFATISPATIHNYRASDKFVLVANLGSMELYWANNRDSGGRNDRVPAIEMRELSYDTALQRDIQLAPMRFVTLIGYKFALFWNHLEVPNNANFYRGQAVSPILQFIPLNFTVLAIFGLLGLATLWHEDKAAFFYLGVMGGWMLTTFLMVWVYGRLKHPAALPLSMLTGYLVVRLIDGVRHGINLKNILKRYLLPIVGIIALVIFSNWAIFPTPKLPIKRHYDALPADAIALDVQFEDVRLVGWRPLPEFWPAARDGYLPVFEEYAIELFWEVLAPTTIEYNFYIAYIDNEQRYTGIDRPLGAVSFPHETTQAWQTGTIYGEIVGFSVDDDIPQARSGQVRIGVWTADESGVITNISRMNGDGFFVLDTLGIFNPYQRPAPPNLPVSDIVFSDASGALIALRGYQMPTQSTTNETISLQFYWEALRDIPENYTLFLHVVDADENNVTQIDIPPIPHLFTDNWMPDYPFVVELALTMPEQAGTYRLYAGLYNSIGRLTVDSPDNRVLLGEIVVE